ncbi:unnamed protein product [Pleuronectes platessa]|uniref:DNA2/NAM7 helicase-like C-terminal domain-containing protein n=1 Tax=Pleuronectes platessa TaxID=8262 RepID=A0A9N7U477_PLEPL|nr:unnamed protein product [Pleuronectes platessa]
MSAGVSLKERLMNDFSQSQRHRGGFNQRYVTKLLRDYRSHPAIFDNPNQLFYDGELESCAVERSRKSFCRWEHLQHRVKKTREALEEVGRDRQCCASSLLS